MCVKLTNVYLSAWGYMNPKAEQTQLPDGFSISKSLWVQSCSIWCKWPSLDTSTTEWMMHCKKCDLESSINGIPSQCLKPFQPGTQQLLLWLKRGSWELALVLESNGNGVLQRTDSQGRRKLLGLKCRPVLYYCFKHIRKLQPSRRIF